MYSDELLLEILTAWLRIEAPSPEEKLFLAKWFLAGQCEDGESEALARAISSLDGVLKVQCLERLVWAFEYATSLDFPSHQLNFHLFNLALVLRNPLLALPILQLRDKHAQRGSWNGQDLSVLSHKALAACTPPRSIVSSGIVDSQPLPRRSRV